MARIFISYKRVDKDKVFHLKDRIEAATGEKCWIDLDGIESDAQFKNIIIKAISMSEIVLFMYSKAHSKIQDFERDWTVRELNFAAFKKKRIVFINLDRSALTDDFAFDFAAKQQVDATDDNAVKRLLSDLCRWLGTTELTSQPATMYDKNNKSISEDIYSETTEQENTIEKEILSEHDQLENNWDSHDNGDYGWLDYFNSYDNFL